MARLARKLRDRPLLRELVGRGEVSARKAQAVIPVARGDGELRWVERARTETVRVLDADVCAAKTADDTEDDEDWERICLDEEQRRLVGSSRWGRSLTLAP